MIAITSGTLITFHIHLTQPYLDFASEQAAREFMQYSYISYSHSPFFPRLSPLPSIYFPGTTFDEPNYFRLYCTTVMAVVIPRVLPESEWTTSEAGESGLW